MQATERPAARAGDSTPTEAVFAAGLIAVSRWLEAPPGSGRRLSWPQVPAGAPPRPVQSARGHASRSSPAGPPSAVRREPYERELAGLRVELVRLQELVKRERQRVVVVFEGRDAAGKGSAIRAITDYLNPRVCRIVALPAPSERERGEWYFQRSFGAIDRA